MSTSDGLSRRFLVLAGPNIASNLLVPLASAIDIALLGHLSTVTDLAAVALGAVLFDYVFWTFGFLRMATTGLTAQSRGREDPAEERLVAWRGLSLAVGAGLAILVLQRPIRMAGFALLQGDPALHAVAEGYYDARILGAPFTLANYVLLGWFLGREQSGRALAMSAVGHGTNIALDVWFIGGLGLGAAGAGAATALSQVAMLMSAAALAGRSIWPEHPRDLFKRIPDPEELARFFALSRDITIRTLLLVSTFAIFTNVAAVMGTAMLAATAVLRQVVVVAAWFIDGFAFAVESLAGVFHGARRSEALGATLRLSLAWAFGTSVGFILLSVGFGRSVLGLLTDKAELLDLVLRYRWWLIPVLGFSAPAYVLDGYFLGLTAGRTLRRAMIRSVLVGFAPLAAMAAWTLNADLLWSSLATFMLARTATLARQVPATLGSRGRSL
jgi:MATE family multidrug resistance protein